MRVAAFDYYAPHLNFRYKNQGRYQQTYAGAPPSTVLGWATRMAGARNMTEIPFQGRVFCNVLVRSSMVTMKNAYFHEPKALCTRKDGVDIKKVIPESIPIDFMFENEGTIVLGFENDADYELFMEGFRQPGHVFRLGRSEGEFEVTQIREDVEVGKVTSFCQTWVPERTHAPSITMDDLQDFRFGQSQSLKIDRHNLTTAFTYYGALPREEANSAVFDFPHRAAETEQPISSAILPEGNVPLIEMWRGVA